MGVTLEKSGPEAACAKIEKIGFMAYCVYYRGFQGRWFVDGVTFTKWGAKRMIKKTCRKGVEGPMEYFTCQQT